MSNCKLHANQQAGRKPGAVARPIADQTQIRTSLIRKSPILGIGFLIPLFFLLAVWTVGGQPMVDEEAAPEPTPTTVPFLYPPFAGTYRVTSYFDHHHPDRAWDDTIVIFNGDQASAIDGILGRTATFRGGYWFPDTTWYIYYDGHNGIDYGTQRGVTILAAAPGEVVFAGSIPSSCATPLQYVCLEHADGYRTYYLHMEGICVHQGDWVETGDPLGISGNSGCSTGPHLHFGVEREWKATDPYGWRPEGRPDPLLAYADVPATWLWAPDLPPAPVGELTDPPPETRTNGELSLAFHPGEDSPPVARVEFLAYYAAAPAVASQWHSLGVDEQGDDGWSLIWDTRQAPEGEVWLHAWATGVDGRVGKGSPIRSGVIVDRHPPQGHLVGLEPSSTAGARLWLYAASYDPDSTTAQVTFLVREYAAGDAAPSEWREIGDARWIHTSNWLLEWVPDDLPDGALLDVVARLTDGAGNVTLTQPVEGVMIERSMPAGQVIHPASGIPITTTLELVFLPLLAETQAGTEAVEIAPIDRVSFYVWHDGDWHLAGTDREGRDGWSVPWDPAPVEDQSRLRVQARIYDTLGRVNTALPQVTALVLDRAPPSAGYVRPRTGGVAHPDVEQQVWAWDDGSGVDRVEFYVNEGTGWLKIGEDNSGEGGWTLSWDGEDVADGIVDFAAQVYDRAGNEAWAPDQHNVAFDRAPPSGEISFPRARMRVSGTVTLTLEVTDTVSGLDRAVFYARYDERWHHLGADAEHEDGFSLAWDTSSLARREELTLTAWVYDRAGNQIELPHVEGVAIELVITPTLDGAPTTSATLLTVSVSPTVPVSPTATVSLTASLSPTVPVSPTVSLSRTVQALPAPSPSTPSTTPFALPSPGLTSIATPYTTATVRLQVAAGTATSQPALAITSTLTPAPAVTSLPPAFWYLIGGGVLVAVVLLLVAARNIWAMR